MPLTDLERAIGEYNIYESAATALSYSEDHGPNASSVVGTAIREVYHRKGMDEDPALVPFFREVSIAEQSGRISGSMISVAKYNFDKYIEAKKNVSIEHIVDRAKSYGLKLDDEDYEIIARYNGRTYSQLKELAEDQKDENDNVTRPGDEEAKRVLKVIDSVVEAYKIEVGLYATLMKKRSKELAKGILRPENEAAQSERPARRRAA